MRKVLISLILASAAVTPAVAGPHDRSDRKQAQEDRQQAREDRQQAHEQQQQAAPSDARAGRQDARAQHNAPQGGQFGGAVRPDRANGAPQMFARAGGGNGGDARPGRGNLAGAIRGNADGYVVPGPRVVTPRQGGWRDNRVQQVRQDRVDAREQRQANHPDRNVIRNHPVVSNVPRPGTQPPLQVQGHRNTPQVHWNTNWRHDRRHDWHNYRNHHRSLFHLGFYIDPYGWGYQPFSIGWRLWPSYYSRNFWINDPGMYQLPYAPPGYVWVRYWNDALLVDTWSGTVVDMIPGFFW